MKSADYGRHPENPIELNSVPASLIFMDNLVTEQGYHILYHRPESLSFNGKNPVDRYEIMTSDNRYEDLFINIYNDRSNWVPPDGFLFENSAEDMCWQLMEREDLIELDDEDIIDFEESYVYNDLLPVNIDDTTLMEHNRMLPPLERILLDSYGSNLYVDDFPNGMI